MEDQRGVLGATQRLTRLLLTDGSVVVFRPLMEGQQRALRDAFGESASALPTVMASSSWDFFCRHIPDEADRVKLLDETFALLIQLVSSVATSSGIQGDKPISRSSLLESEITPHERTLLERLLRAGVVCRRVSHASERAIEIADDSILFSWNQLAHRLVQNLECIRQREALIGARRSWIASGRRISLLKEVTDEVATIESVSERGTWLGNRSLEFLNAVKEAKASLVEKMALEDRLTATASQLSFESEARRALEQQLQESSAKKLGQALILRGRWGFGALLASGFAVASLVILYVENEKRAVRDQFNADVLSMNSQAEKERRDAALALAQVQIEREKLIALERKREEETIRRLATFEATQRLAYGLDFSRSKKWKEASAEFSEAIRLDPTLAEAYFYRARTSQRLGNSQNEMEDYASFFDLRPSLSGRVNLIQSMSRVATINDALFNRQVDAAYQDSMDPASRNISLEVAAKRLKSILDSSGSKQTRLHADVEANLRRVISLLDPKTFSSRSTKPSAMAEVEAVAGAARKTTTGNSSEKFLTGKFSEDGRSGGRNAAGSPTREKLSAPKITRRDIDQSKRDALSAGSKRAASIENYSPSQKAFSGAAALPPTPPVRPLPTLEPTFGARPAK